MDDIVRLAKPRKKGLLHLVFSRFFLIAGLLILQILMVISFNIWLSELLTYFSVITALVVIGGVIYLFSSDMDSSAKLTWMFVIAIAPITGAALLFFTQMNFGHRRILRKIKEQIGATHQPTRRPAMA